MCDKEIDQLLLRPRLYHRALDVSMCLSHLPADTDITYTGRSTLPTAAFVMTGKTVALLIGSMALTPLAMFTPITHRWCRFPYVGSVSSTVVSYAEGKRRVVRTTVFVERF